MRIADLSLLRGMKFTQRWSLQRRAFSQDCSALESQATIKARQKKAAILLPERPQSCFTD